MRDVIVAQTSKKITFRPLRRKRFRCNFCEVILKKNQLRSHALKHCPNPVKPKRSKDGPVVVSIVMAYGDDRDYFDCRFCRSEVYFIDMAKIQICKGCGKNFRVSKESPPRRRSLGYYSSSYLY